MGINVLPSLNEENHDFFVSSLSRKYDAFVVKSRRKWEIPTYSTLMGWFNDVESMWQDAPDDDDFVYV